MEIKLNNIAMRPVCEALWLEWSFYEAAGRPENPRRPFACAWHSDFLDFFGYFFHQGKK